MVNRGASHSSIQHPRSQLRFPQRERLLKNLFKILGINVLPLVLSPKITAPSFIAFTEFERNKKASKACDLKRKHPGAEAMGMLVKSCQASVHCTIAAKAAERALRILTDHSNYMWILGRWEATPSLHKAMGNCLLSLFTNPLSCKSWLIKISVTMENTQDLASTSDTWTMDVKMSQHIHRLSHTTQSVRKMLWSKLCVTHERDSSTRTCCLLLSASYLKAS